MGKKQNVEEEKCKWCVLGGNGEGEREMPLNEELNQGEKHQAMQLCCKCNTLEGGEEREGEVQ